MRDFLSKSRVLSARQCLKRLHLETHQPQLASVSAATEAAFRSGRRVGEIARSVVGGDEGILIPYEGGLEHALRKTRRLMDCVPAKPLFEATFRYRGVLIRTDILLPGRDGWGLVEIKASASVKDQHAFDCAIQYWVLHGLGIELKSVHLAHIDTQFEYRGDGDYRGLFYEVDMTEEVRALLPAVRDWVERARSALGPEQPDVPLGPHCNQPYDCPFMAHCWPSDSDFPVQQLPRASKATLARLIADGYTDLREVPAARLTEEQRRVQSVARSGHAELLPGAARQLERLDYPRYYLDFETVAPAIPSWAGTRPYETLPVQWSCHIETAPSRVAHAEFLDLSGHAPMRACAESVIRVLGHSGPVFVYTRYEQRVIDGLQSRFPDLEPALQTIKGRLFDLEPLLRHHFYAPSMAGSWSLKAVIPAISATLDYKKLEGIQEGTEASEGYLEAIDPATPETRRAELRTQLLAYCRIDTEAMVELTQFLSGSAQPGAG